MTVTDRGAGTRLRSGMGRFSAEMVLAVEVAGIGYRVVQHDQAGEYTISVYSRGWRPTIASARRLYHRLLGEQIEKGWRPTEAES